MIIYNVTINVDESIHSDWLKWMQNKHINDVLATGLFTNAKMVKVLVGCTDPRLRLLEKRNLRGREDCRSIKNISRKSSAPVQAR